MKYLKIVAMFAIICTLSAVSVSAQKKGGKKGTKAVSTVAPLDVRAAREKVSIQLANVDGFVNKLGVVAQGLEVADRDAAAGNLRPATAAKIKAKKEEIVVAIRNIKAGLSVLESEFRTKPALQKYLPTIEGITDLSANSEDLALAGKFVDAKAPLRDVAKKLTDTMASLPL